jgi:hypothetical protein
MGGSQNVKHCLRAGTLARSRHDSIGDAIAVWDNILTIKGAGLI